MTLRRRAAAIPTHDDLSTADAEAAATLASVRAEQARLRANQLRRHAETVAHAASGRAPASIPLDDGKTARDGFGQNDDDTAPASLAAGSPRRFQSRRPRRRTLVVAIAVLCVCTSFGASGAMWWSHRTTVEKRQRTAEFTKAARAEITELMSIDFTKARDGVQRVIDDSTGQFKNQFQASADNLIAGLEQSKVTTSVTVNAVAVQGMTGDSAVVLVAATSQASSLQGAQRDAQEFRVILSLQRADGRLKMSRVEFVSQGTSAAPHTR